MPGLKEKGLVIFFLPTLEGGGAERVFINLANGFAQSGYKVEIALARAVGQYLQDVSEDVKVVDFKARKMRNSFLPFMRYVQKKRPQAIISGMLIPNIFASLAGLIFPTVVIQTVHSQYSHEKKSGKFKPLEGFLFECSIRWADQVVAVSQGAAEDLIASTGCPVNKVKVIYNPIITPAVEHLCRQPVEQAWFQPGQPPVILCVGRLVAEKNQQELLQAFLRVRSQCPARLMILGEGPQRPALEKLARELGLGDDFSLPGAVNNPYAYLSRGAVMVLTSLYEGLPTVLVEAMACSCPVVASNCPGGTAEILAGGQYGHLTPIHDEDALARAVLAVLNGDRRLPPAEWLKQFEIETVCRQYIDLFNPEV